MWFFSPARILRQRGFGGVGGRRYPVRGDFGEKKATGFNNLGRRCVLLKIVLYGMALARKIFAKEVEHV
ncbi:MAG: hypothetical protein GX564_10860 [Oligosphaeraceae bacterium]|nr:hypothetical protein [Oligosphaeraceae bacterium]